jgi:hypothetical protein
MQRSFRNREWLSDAGFPIAVFSLVVVSQNHWFRFGIMTLFLCTVLLRVYWPARKSLWFWTAFFIFLAAHCLGVGHLWATYSGSLILPLSLLAVGELIVMALLLRVTGLDRVCRAA